ncbi:MAG: phosphatidylglycerophosphatase A [Thermodesulfobacteriota bacterium]
MDRLFMAIATGCGAGYLPKAPGTWGSLAAIPLWLLLRRLDLSGYGIAVAVVFVLGVISAGQAEKIMDRKDPSVVVIDEIVGMLITLAGAPATPGAILVGFLLFRFFDIAKPWPVRFFDRRINGGAGIILDDVAAGLYGLGCLRLILYFWPGL